MSKHSPGPLSAFVWDQNKPHILTIGGYRRNEEQDHICSIDISGAEEEMRANAVLFAAAPMMLAALKKMTGFHQGVIDSNPEHGYSMHAQSEIEKAWDVINRAEGR